jgi:hypothetical protein
MDLDAGIDGCILGSGVIAWIRLKLRNSAGKPVWGEERSRPAGTLNGWLHADEYSTSRRSLSVTAVTGKGSSRGDETERESSQMQVAPKSLWPRNHWRPLVTLRLAVSLLPGRAKVQA